MTILLLDQFADLGGAQRCLLDVAPALRQAGWETHAALPGEGPFRQRLAEQGVTVHPLSLSNYSSGRKGIRDAIRFLADVGVVAREIRALAERLDAAVVYVNGPRVMPAVARAALDRPVIFHALSRVTAWNGSALVRRAVRRAGATVIAASRFTWDGPARVIYSGVEGPGPGWSRHASAAPRIGLVGRIAPQKRQKEFVQAATRLPRDWQFSICGDALFGDRGAQRYKQEVLALAPPSVRYLGWRENVYEVLAELDLLVVPSAGEGGVSRVILEAFAAGVPVLALDSGAIPEVVVDGENGFLLRSAAPAEIARRLEELVPRQDLLRAVTGRASALWREKFTVERYRSEVWEVISTRNSRAAARPTPEAASKAAG